MRNLAPLLLMMTLLAGRAVSYRVVVSSAGTEFAVDEPR